jgi:hypothetical protein
MIETTTEQIKKIPDEAANNPTDTKRGKTNFDTIIKAVRNQH